MLGTAGKQRLCIISEVDRDCQSKVSSALLELGLKTLQQMTRTFGGRSYGVFDLQHFNEINTSQIIKTIELIPGIISCDWGHFTSGMDKANSERICIVHRNKENVLLAIVDFIALRGFRILSQLSQAKSRFSYTILDLEPMSVEKVELSYTQLCEQMKLFDDVVSCDQKKFSPGSLSRFHLLDPTSSEAKSSNNEDSIGENNEAKQVAGHENDSGYETEDESDLKRGVSRKKEKSSEILNLRHPHEYTRLSSFSGVPANHLKGTQAVLETTNNYYEGAQSITLDVKPDVKGPMKERTSLTNSQSRKLIIAMVGLPCRGKSFTARKLEQFLNWKGVRTKIFNAGKYRRDKKELEGAKADFFNAKNVAGTTAREHAAMNALEDLLNYLKSSNGDVAIFDATNSVKSRRQTIVQQCSPIASVVFVEVICDDPDLLEENYLIKIRNSPDFLGLTETQALEDLKARVKNYEEAYETIEENENLSYIKSYNISSKVMTKGVYGRISRSIVPYLSALHVGSRSVILVRAGLGSSVSPIKRSIGKRFRVVPSMATEASQLGDKGVAFSRRLALWLKTMLFMRKPSEIGSSPPTSKDLIEAFPAETQSIPQNMKSLVSIFRELSEARASVGSELDDSYTLGHARPRAYSREVVRLDDCHPMVEAELKVITSTLPRAIETANIALESLLSKNEIEPVPMLNPINKGEFSNLSNEEIKKKFPDWWRQFSENPFHARFPGGENYHDIVMKLEPVIIDIEQQTAPVLVVAHISTLQMLLAYFKKIPVSEAVGLEFPMHSLIELQPMAGGGWKETFCDLDNFL